MIEALSAALHQRYARGMSDDGGDEGAGAPAPFDEDPQLRDRYVTRARLGSGTSGDVTLCFDRRIGREVAIKVLRDMEREDASARGRFLREARIQGRLEHPGIVPVHDLGESPSGRPWFTMKALRGETLRDVLARLPAADGDATSRADARYTKARLLSAFARVCRTVDFAHAEGVVHRDLSPANIMLGEYGEVSVLDWGLAKPLADSEVTRTPVTDSEDEPSQTRPGTALGTPGYLAPEQALGEVEVGPEADVYALASILFEILSRRPLHGAGSARQRLEEAIRGVDPRVVAKRLGVEVPPELDPVLVRATAADPTKRTRSAGELAAAVEAYLDGDRDLAERSRLADALVEDARARLAKGDTESRADATRMLGRAVALVPSHADAVAELSRLLLGPAGAAPNEVVSRRLATWADELWRASALRAAGRYTLWAVFLPVWWLMGVRDWTLYGVGAALILSMSIAMGLVATNRIRGGVPTALVFLLSVTGITYFTQVLSPIIVAPTLMATNLVVFTSHSPRWLRVGAISVSVAGMALAIGLEWAGVLPATFEVVRDTIVISSRIVHFEPFWTYFVLFAGATVSVAIPGIVAGETRDALVSAQRRILQHAWHLEQLLPR